jgi:uncharacterized protein with HEPN domain
MYAMRNRVSHGYFKVDYELIWITIYLNCINKLNHYLKQNREKPYLKIYPKPLSRLNYEQKN